MLMMIITVFYLLFPSIDKRFPFNVLFYLIGLVSAPYFDWKFRKASYVKLIYVLFFIGALVIAHFNYSNLILKYRKLFGGLGVIALLFCCDWLSGIVFKKDSIIAVFFKNVSFASMACYMFHRLFFWAGEKIWDPSTGWIKWLYMAGVIFPVMLVLSYYLQKGYDLLLERVGAKNAHYL